MESAQQGGPTQDSIARFAGLLYLLLIPTAAPGIMSGQLAIKDSPAATLAGIVESRTMFELTTLLGVIGFIDFLLLAMVLHRLFRPVCKPAADVMLAFVAVSIPLSLAAMAFRLDILNLLDAASGLPQFAGEELEGQVALSLARSNNMMQLAVIFWGLWLLPLGKLAQDSGFVPRILGTFLMIGGLFYIVSFAGYVLDSDYQQSTIAAVVGVVGGIPVMLGELGIALWLLIKGASWRSASKSE